MEEQIKNIVSGYIKIPVEQITASTVIDRSAVASSIILHRMYAQLANEGVPVSDYTSIKTFGQLLLNINGKESTGIPVETSPPVAITPGTPAIGIDIENISSMPVVKDHREDNFYKMNFAPGEIAYCILQPDPYASFAGLFAAKEAIIKADNSYKNKAFNTIIIDHLPGGQPVHAGFQLSISHTPETAIAVAVKDTPAHSPVSFTGNHSAPFPFLSLAAILLSLFTLIVILFKTC